MYFKGYPSWIIHGKGRPTGPRRVVYIRDLFSKPRGYVPASRTLASYLDLDHLSGPSTETLVSIWPFITREPFASMIDGRKVRGKSTYVYLMIKMLKERLSEMLRKDEYDTICFCNCKGFFFITVKCDRERHTGCREKSNFDTLYDISKFQS